MSSGKERILNAIRQLPEDATIPDVARKLWAEFRDELMHDLDPRFSALAEAEAW